MTKEKEAKKVKILINYIDVEEKRTLIITVVSKNKLIGKITEKNDKALAELKKFVNSL